MNNKPNIGILGCGWLGLAFAKALIASGYKVKGTTTTAEKLSNLEQLGVEAYQLEVAEEGIAGNIAGFLNGLDFLLINIPPGLRSSPQVDFPKRISNILKFVDRVQLKQLVFISSTSVFADTSPPTTYTEKDLPNPDKNNGQQIYQAELKVREYFHTAIIVRPGGLLGGDRHPVKYLAGRKNIPNPDAPVNLTSQESLVSLLMDIVSGNQSAPVIHCISEPHISRKEFYHQAAKEHGLQKPEFQNNGAKGKKVVSVI